PTLPCTAISATNHRLSMLLTLYVGDQQRTVLLDAGPEAATLLHNAAILGVDFGAVDAVVLSHGHWDHGGGLLAAVEAIAQRRRGFACYLHPGMFAQCATTRPDGLTFVNERLQIGRAHV